MGKKDFFKKRPFYQQFPRHIFCPFSFLSPFKNWEELLIFFDA